MTERTFFSERQLIAAFLSFLRQTATPKNYRATLELETGHGIADIVLFEGRRLARYEAALLDWMPSRLMPILIRGALPKQFDLTVFERRTGLSEKSARDVCRRLASTGWFAGVDNETYELRRSLASPVGKIVAIEAKLSKWQPALIQAYRYREFGHQSWVLLDHARVEPATLATPIFARSGIGLASLSRDGHLFIHVKARTGTPFSAARHWSLAARLPRSATVRIN